MGQFVLAVGSASWQNALFHADKHFLLQVLMVEETHIHEKWIKDKSQRSPWNVALLELPSPSSKAHPMVLVDHFTLKTGQGLIAVGWGPNGDGPKLGSDIFGSLKLEPQEFIAGKHCNQESLWNGAIPEDLMCGLNQDRKASCVGQYLCRGLGRLICQITTCSLVHMEILFSFPLFLGRLCFL